MKITLRPWKYAEDLLLPLRTKDARYLLVLDDLPLESSEALRGQASRNMGLAPRHRYVLPTASPKASADLLGPNTWPALWVSHPLTELDAMRIAAFLDVEAWCRIVLSPARSARVLSAARAVGAVVLEATREKGA